VIPLLVDQNFNQHIVEGLMRRDPDLDLIHVREVGLEAAPDPAILEWAAQHDRVLLTHDRRTIPPFAYARVAAGQAMPGVFLVSDDMPTGQTIDEILLAVHCLTPDECKDIVKYFPLG
jgi:predicted nuclease of predicted toxin-antitoxin system